MNHVCSNLTKHCLFLFLFFLFSGSLHSLLGYAEICWDSLQVSIKFLLFGLGCLWVFKWILACWTSELIQSFQMLSSFQFLFKYKWKSVEWVFLYVIRLYRATENTNQRVFFDIEPCGRHLGTGGQVLLIFLPLLLF